MNCKNQIKVICLTLFSFIILSCNKEQDTNNQKNSLVNEAEAYFTTELENNSFTSRSRGNFNGSPNWEKAKVEIFSNTEYVIIPLEFES